LFKIIPLLILVATDPYQYLFDSLKPKIATCEAFRPSYDSTQLSMDYYVWGKAKEIAPDSVKYYGKYEIDFTHGRYRFDELPDIYFYTFLSSLSFITCTNPGDPYAKIIFNTVDSSIYHFSGSIESFENVIRSSLPNVIKRYKMWDLIYFYLNTLGDNEPYYLIYKIEDYQYFWMQDTTRLPRDFWCTPTEKIREDTEIVRKNLTPPHTKSIKNGYEVNLWTWEYDEGKIENWNFKVTNNEFKLIAHKVLSVKMGPYRPTSILHRD
jgi:hypothetical protein